MMSGRPFLDFIMSPSRGEGGHIGFSADPIGILLLLPPIFHEPMGGISPNLHRLGQV